MIDLDIARSGINATCANFKGWTGVNTNGVKNMEEIKKEMAEEQNVEKQDFKEMPRKKEAYINPTELKNIAISLLPKAGMEKHDYELISKNAIEYAFAFLETFDKIIKEGE